MPNEEWTPAIGLRRAALSLVWRGLIVALIWCVALWVFHAVLNAIGVVRVPIIIAGGFSALLGVTAGLVISRGLGERAGFVSPLLTLIAVAFAALAIIGSEALFVRLFPFASNELRFVIVGVTMVIATIWIVKYTLLEG